MNDFSELEADLRKLRPRAAAPELAVSIARVLAAATPAAGVIPRRRRFRLNWFAMGLGLAAAAAFLVLARVEVPRTPTESKTAAAVTPSARTRTKEEASLLPVGLTQVTYRTQDEGLLFNRGADRPVRRLRSQTQETLRWRNPATGASLHVSYPSEEVTLIPVSGQ